MKTMGLILTCMIVLLFGGCSEESGDAQLLIYRDVNGHEHRVKTVVDWRKRRDQILDGMQLAMGLLPDRSKLPALDVQITETFNGDGFTRLKLSFVAECNDRVPAYLFLPKHKNGRRSPAMFALHQTTEIGKDEPAGVGGKANFPYGLELANRGYVVLVPDYPSFGDYKDYDFESDRYVSGTMKGIFNHMRCVDLLEGRLEVDPERIGVIGHSLGGHNAMFVGAFDSRLKVIVSSCGWTPFHDYYSGKIAGWTSDRYMPRLRDVYNLDPNRVPFDFYGVVAAIAPRAFFSNSPINDDNFDVSGVRKAVPVAREVYQLFDAADKLQVSYPTCEHDFPQEVREESYRFIDKVLRHSPQ